MLGTHFSSLRWRVSLSITGLVLLSTALCVVGTFLFLGPALTNQARTELSSTLGGVSGYMDNQRSDVLGAAKLVADDPTIVDAIDRRDRQSLIVYLTPYFAELNVDVLDVVDARGRVMARMENTLAYDDSMASLPNIRQARAGHENVAAESDPKGEEGAGGYALRATVPIRSGGRVIGVIVVGRQLGSDFARRIGRSVAAEVNLIAGGQRTGTTVRDSQGLPATGLPEPASVLRRIKTGRSSIAQVQEDGQTVLSGLVPLRGSDGRWIGAVEVVRPLSPVYDVTRQLSLLLLVLGVLVVALGTLLGLSVSRRLTSRLLGLKSFASDVAGLAHTGSPLGDLHATPVVQGDDEVASLGRSFAAMMAALDERMHANAELYQAAQERVRELSGLAEIARLLTSVESLRDTMDNLAHRVCDLVGCPAVAIWLPVEGGRPALYGGFGLPAEYEELSNRMLEEMDGTDHSTSAQHAIRTGEIIRANLVLDAELPLDSFPATRLALRRHLDAHGWRESTAVPLRVQGRVVGAMTCYTADNPLSESDLSLLVTIADQVAVVVENARLAAEAVQERDLRYRSIFEASMDGLIITDPATGRVVEANPAVCRMHGYSYEEFIGIEAPKFVHPDHHAVLQDFIETIAAGGSYEARAQDIRKDGTAFNVEVHGTPLMYEGRPHILAIVSDVTERVKAEEQLREREEQYRSIFEATSDGLEILDRDGYIAEVNAAACEMHGYTYDEMIGMHVSTLIRPEYADLIPQDLHTIQEGRETRNQTPGVRKDGTVFFAEARGTRLTYRGKPHVLVVVRDVTERIKAYELLEQRVAERTRELSTLLDISHNVASTLELEPLLDLILDQLKVFADYNGAAVLLLDGEDLVVRARRTPHGAAGPDRYPLNQARPILDLLGQGQMVIIDDVHEDTPSARAYRTSVGEHLDTAFSHERSVMNVPMMLKDRMIGALSLSSAHYGYFTERHGMLTLAVASQAAIAIENARLYEQAREVAAYAERQRLARELHDSVSQALYGIALGARTARTLLDRDPSRVADPLDYVLAQAAAGLAEMRALIFELRPEALEAEGLVAALEKQVESVRARHGLEVEATLPAEPNVPFAVKETLYRITQEALHNTVKHARARRVNLCLEVTPDGLVLRVTDDGRGFDPTDSFPGHLGLKTMRERASQVHGTLSMTSVPGQGRWSWTGCRGPATSVPGQGTNISVCVPVETAVSQAS